jgi:hypothetical protein
MNEPIKLERGAVTLADLAFIETKGSNADRVWAALWAYQWAVRNTFERDGLTYWPSLDQLRAALAGAR